MHVRRTLRTALIIWLGPLSACASLHAPPEEYRRAALSAGAWIDACAIERDSGLVWPVDPKQPKRVSTNLYAGTPGVVLFFLEAFASTGEDRYLRRAMAGADSLLRETSAGSMNGSAGLYTGLAGIGFTLHEVYKVGTQQAHLDGAGRCVDLLARRAKRVGAGVQWSAVTDIISGSAGTGLFLLYAAEQMKDERALSLAESAGRRLLEVARPEASGLKWAMQPRYARLMPNFSHGTAGVCYFLARLYGATGKREFLDAAIAGAAYLRSICGKQCLVFHHEPGGERLFYLGWCHGPAGTARLFHLLHSITGERSYSEWIETAAASIMASGIPERATAGFWNNVGMCCGSAGVADFFLDLHRVTGEAEYLEFSRRVTANLLERSQTSESGISWLQAEHRTRPKLLQAQTGWAQGAAGIGLFLLKLDAFGRGAKPSVRLPDALF